MFTAMILTRTRAAVIPTLVIIGFVLAWWLAMRGSRQPILRTCAVVALVLTTGGLLLATFNPFELLGSSADNSLRFRLATTLVAVRMVKQHALFGVGIAHYPLNFITFRDPMPTVLFGQGIEEAHNYFLWIAAELGLVGLVGFLWLLGGAVRRIWRRLWSDAGDWEFLGMSAGVGRIPPNLCAGPTAHHSRSRVLVLDGLGGNGSNGNQQ